MAALVRVIGAPQGLDAPRRHREPIISQNYAWELVGLSQYAGSAGWSVLVAPIRAAAESRPRLIGTAAVAAANP